MARKRASGEGTIYKNDQKGIWVAELNLPDGKRKRKTSKSQSVVKEWLRDTINKAKDGTLPIDGKYTVAEFCDLWLKDVGANTLRPKTLELYEGTLRLHVKPELGNIKLTSLRSDQIQRLYTHKIEAGLSKRSVELTHAVIHRILETALKWNLISRNPADSVEPPRPDKKEIVPLTVDQVQIFIKATKKDRLYPLWMVLLGCGLRRGEALALRAEDIDLDNRIITVRHNVQWLHGKGFIFGEPKTDTGRRTVGLPVIVSDALAPILKDKLPDDLVFTTSNGNPHIPRNITKYFKEALKKACLPQKVRLHDLRHTFVSYLITQVPIKDAQAIAGHSSINVTFDLYGHLLPNAHRNAADKMDGMFK